MRLDILAQKLSLIASRPNSRGRPKQDDLNGDYDEWFDGGAIRFYTGATEFFFSDGLSAKVPLCAGANFSVDFPDGSQVLVNTQE